MKLVATQFTLEPIQTFIRNQLSPCTQTAYEADLRQFFGYVSVESIEAVTASSIVEYRNYLSSRYEVSSVNRKLSAVRALFRYLTESGVITINPATAVKLFPAADNATTEALSDTEVCSILSTIDSTKHAGSMHHAVLSMMLYLGLRGAELRSIRFEDIGEDRGVRTVTVFGKGARKRVIPIPTNVWESVTRYLSIRAPEVYVQGPLFSATVGDGSKALCHGTLTKIIRQYAKRAGITKKISPHSLRATCISNALENGATLVQVQYLAGWTTSSMVARYDKRSQILNNSAAYAVNYGE